jgi:hypothetical protein
MPRLLATATMLLMIFISSSCLASDATIRVINEKGKALAKTKVNVFLYYEARNRHSSRDKEFSFQTDDRGEVRVPLGDPEPVHMDISVGLSGKEWDCICYISVPMRAVVQDGIMTSVRDEYRQHLSVKQKAREITVVARRLPWWLRMFSHFYEE